MYVEDLKEVLRTNLTTTKKRYSHGRLRMEMQLCMQLAGFTANRPQALLNLCHGHITATLPPIREAALTGSYLSSRSNSRRNSSTQKMCMYKTPSPIRSTAPCMRNSADHVSSNTFPIPEIVYDPSLVFSPHVTLLGMKFDDQAFAAPSLTSPEKLSMLNIGAGLQSTTSAA
jgi:hypothetical protein